MGSRAARCPPTCWSVSRWVDRRRGGEQVFFYRSWCAGRSCCGECLCIDRSLVSPQLLGGCSLVRSIAVRLLPPATMLQHSRSLLT